HSRTPCGDAPACGTVSGVWSDRAVTQTPRPDHIPGPRTAAARAGARVWPGELDGLLDRDWTPAAGGGTGPGERDRWVVRGGPGSGKTALLVDVVRSAVTGGAGLDGVLVLTASATAGAALLEDVTAGLGPEYVVGTDAPARTVHSLAHAVLRLAAARADAPPCPRWDSPASCATCCCGHSNGGSAPVDSRGSGSPRGGPRGRRRQGSSVGTRSRWRCVPGCAAENPASRSRSPPPNSWVRRWTHWAPTRGCARCPGRVAWSRSTPPTTSIRARPSSTPRSAAVRACWSWWRTGTRRSSGSGAWTAGSPAPSLTRVAGRSTCGRGIA